MKYLYLYVTSLLICMPNLVWAGANQFCIKKFGQPASLRFIPPESDGVTSVSDGIYGTKVTETTPVVSPSGFVCVIAMGSETKSCKAKMKFDAKTFVEPHCVSEVFSLRRLCPKEVLVYSKVLKPDLCGKK